jgi:hypothetical protein
MHRPFRVLALALALFAIPACAALPIASPRLENPLVAARTLDQRAYALLHAYAGVIEEATDIVRDPTTPPAVLSALAGAERIATPAAESLSVAVRAYLSAQAQLEAASARDPSDTAKAATALASAATDLNQAIAAAQAPVAELSALVSAVQE